MHWTFADIPALVAHLPHAVYDLIRHEDPALVAAGKGALKPLAVPPAPLASGDSPRISIEKTIDPFTQRSAQNMGLLLHDYLYHLPSFEAAGHEGEKLLEHWRQILQDQPERLSVAKQSYWNTPEAREFWKHRLEKYRTDFGIDADGFPEWEEWQRLAGAERLAHPTRLSAAKARQWQDLVIRTRLHQVSKAREMEW